MIGGFVSREAELEVACRAVIEGRVVVYPTETVYGLGASAFDVAALETLLALKGRDARKGVSVLVPDLSRARSLLGVEPPAAAVALAEACWPGPLTIVLPASHALDPLLRGPHGGVALRCSTDPFARALCEQTSLVITATSANPSGLAPARSIEEARAYFGDRVAAYVDGGPRRSTAVSSVVEFCEGRAYLRREGAIPLSVLRRIVDIEEPGAIDG